MQLLQYWKTQTTIVASADAGPGTNYLQITFVRRPAESGVTYHVQESANLIDWSDIATYAGSNIQLTAQATEVSRVGSPNESVMVRDMSGTGRRRRVFSGST